VALSGPAAERNDGRREQAGAESDTEHDHGPLVELDPPVGSVFHPLLELFQVFAQLTACRVDVFLYFV